MHIKEIRWGNIIGSKLKPEGWRVYFTDFQFIEEMPDDYFGIPLTPEWLERFGFEKTIMADYHHIKQNIYLHSGHHEFWFGWSIGLNAKLEHVHQLQNLYHSLTGQELELKPRNNEKNTI